MDKKQMGIRVNMDVWNERDITESQMNEFLGKFIDLVESCGWATSGFMDVVDLNELEEDEKE